jgi:hypothetical protein
MKKHAAPIIAALLLLLPVLYVASYFALVVPQGRAISIKYRGAAGMMQIWKTTSYRSDGQWAAKIFWPLEQIDRKVRPLAWGLHLPIDPQRYP